MKAYWKCLLSSPLATAYHFRFQLPSFFVLPLPFHKMSTFVPRRSARVAAKSCAAIVASKKSDVDTVATLLTAAEDKNIAVRAVAVVTLFDYLIANPSLWQTHERFQKVALYKAIEFKIEAKQAAALQHPDVPACVYERVQEMSHTLAQAIVRFRLEQAVTHTVKSF